MLLYLDYLPSLVIAMARIYPCAILVPAFCFQHIRGMPRHVIVMVVALMPAPGEHKRDELIAALERKVAQIEGMQAQLAHSKAQLLGVIEVVRAQPEGVPCSMGQQQLLGAIKEPM